MGHFFEDSDDDDAQASHISACCRVICNPAAFAFIPQIGVCNPVILTDNEMELDPPIDDEGSTTSVARENLDTCAQNYDRLSSHRTHSSSQPPYRLSHASPPSSSPPPLKRRRPSPLLHTRPTKVQRTPMSDRAGMGDRTQSGFSQGGFLGDFIVEAWATTSDTKTNTYIHAGDRVIISRSDSESSIHSDARNKGKGTQAKLVFAPKSKTKRNPKENNIVRFLNSKGSGENHPHFGYKGHLLLL